MIRVLIIDDDRGFATEAAEELRLAGFEVDAAFTYTQAVQLLDAQSYKVISLDIMIAIRPDEVLDRRAADYGRGTGLLIYERIRALRPEPAVVVCSVIGDRVWPDFPKGTPTLVKPVSVDQYVKAIKDAAGVQG